jgi:hypothetical protein
VALAAQHHPDLSARGKVQVRGVPIRRDT